MNRAILSTILIGLSTLPIRAEISHGENDLVLGDFEGESYDPWTATGDAFGTGPARGSLASQMPVTGFHGARLANSFHGGDDSTGTLTSPPFAIERNHIAFLIGGGKRPGKLELQLVIDGQVVLGSTGTQDKPGGTEALEPGFWDVRRFKGKTATLRIIDEAKGGWGHINVDHIVQMDAKPPGLWNELSVNVSGEAPYLLIPIRNGAPKRTFTLRVDGKVVARNDIELAEADDADWYAPMDLGPWKGKDIYLRVDRLSPDPAALDRIVRSREPRPDPKPYSEPLRAQYHFSSARGWLNDPNGCVFYNGEYHLFYQHNPYGITWGNMHWGHAVSPDLVHWKELGDALFPDDTGMMYSGSAVVDWKNTSGFGKDGKPPLILFYTAAGDEYTQCLAWSTDGRTFTKYAENPVVKQVTHGNRDPKVIWHEPTKQWVMAVYVELNKVHTIHFHTSPDLKHWTFASKTDGFFECPDLFELPVDGDPAKKKWVLTAASSEYQVGSFDGKAFKPETPMLPGHRGKGFYAAQSFSDVPDGRRVFIGWWQTETKGMPFNQSMSLPLELNLVTTPDGPRLTFTPVKELEKLRVKTLDFGNSDYPFKLPRGAAMSLTIADADLYEMRVEFEPGDAEQFEIELRGHAIAYDMKTQQLIVNGHAAAAPLIGGRQRMTLYCDRNGLEVFASDGQCYIPMPGNADPKKRSFSLSSKTGTPLIHAFELHELRSALQR
ncbi:glycoside hydrolase family 32 protein [Luteolibacter sp. LG18]|uniref:glycoside hydrolase family 32 protein n=1 Tax=Luteolibacter sp. LG18 TaxID=2819286 RepID=UPI002B30F77B|nr:hypothetical protein llg_26370 [Luteolibacter sp. LG18]